MMKPNILICGPDQYASTELLIAATPVDTIPENKSEDTPCPESEKTESGKDGNPDGKQKSLIRRFIETPVANFIEANEITVLGEEGSFPENLSMSDYVKKVETELRTGDYPFDSDAKVDAVWFCTCGVPFMIEEEKDFIRSAAGTPNTLIVFGPSIVSNRTEFKKEINTLTELAGIKRIVLAPAMSCGLCFSALVSGVDYLIEKTEMMYLNSSDATDEEKNNFDAAWRDYYRKRSDEWRESLDETLNDCIGQAAGRANFILNKPTDASLTDLVGEGIDLLHELVDILKGNTEIEDKPRKQALVHTAELRENVELMIYEIGACYGHAATAHDVDLVLKHSRTSVLPNDAAAVTYAVGQVAKAYFEFETEYNSKDLLTIYRKAKEEAMEMEFKPYDDANPFADLDGIFELNEEDLEDSDDEQEDGDGTDIGGESVDDVHEPADELPEDCRVDNEPNRKD